MNVEDKGEIAVIDGRTDKLVARWPLKNCEEPSGLALDEAHSRLFSVCSNKVMAVTDSATGRQIAQVAIGGHPDAAVYDAASGTVISSNGEGNLSVVHQRDADHYDAAVTVATARGARTLALDPASHRLFLPALAGENFTVLVVSP
jgi:DNA-binding beta-propeller fold protein YncE